MDTVRPLVRAAFDWSFERIGDARQNYYLEDRAVILPSDLGKYAIKGYEVVSLWETTIPANDADGTDYWQMSDIDPIFVAATDASRRRTETAIPEPFWTRDVSEDIDAFNLWAKADKAWQVDRFLRS